jgi:hypothetical protein
MVGAAESAPQLAGGAERYEKAIGKVRAAT